MPSITIKGEVFSYSENEIINFNEGLIGLPHIRRAVLIPLPDCEPFYWLASMDDEKFRFVVVNPHEIFPEYNPSEFVIFNDSQTKILAIVKVSSDWQKTTVNLRAPILINKESNRGLQMVLSESPYHLEETLPQN
jgi:flagellar assembly factor FliW